MSYVKNYQIGQTRIDNTYHNFVHELPLLTFGDARNTFALSLIFQSRITSNSFYIANGYRLSLQKKIIFSGGYPVSYEDGDGNTYKINRISGYSDKFSFDDGSYRFIRIINGLYVLENPDYSTESFDSNGNILSVADKYGNTLLTYTYYSGRLTSISFKGRKTVNITYSGSSIQYIQYTYAGTTYRTAFAYSGNKITVSHYSGVDYHLNYTSGDFEVYSTDNGGAYSNEYSQKNAVTVQGESIIIEKYIGSKEIDRSVYSYYVDSSDGRVTFLDITNQNYVHTRVQIRDGKPTYSYEMLDTMFIARPNSSAYSYYPGRVTFYNNDGASGYQNHDDGIAMAFEGTSEAGSNGYYMLHAFSGMMTVSGWVKPVVDIRQCTVTITDTHDNVLSTETVSGLNQGDWAYFSVSFYQENDVVIHARLSESVAIVESCDFRLTGQHYSQTALAEYKDNLIKSAGVFIYTKNNGVDQAIPITDKINYINGSTTISSTNYPMNANDLMRYKINQAIGTNKGEIYYDNGRGILQLTGEFYLNYTTSAGDSITASINSLAIGKMYSSNNNEYVTKSNFYTQNETARLKTQSTKNSITISEEICDEHIDLIESTVNGITTVYTRNVSNGLITSKSINDPADPQNSSKSLITSAVYDSNDFLVSTTNEFGVVSTYTTDAAWGVITKTVIKNASTVIDTVTDTFNDDFSVQTAREFGADSTTKLHSFAYSNGRLYSMQNGALNYTMEYNADILSSVKKNTQLMCEFSTEDNIYLGKTDKEFYPGSSSPLYTVTNVYDKYNRLKTVENLIENTYSIAPMCSNGTYTASNVDNGYGKLATSTDKTNSNVTKYAYKKDRISDIGVFNSSGTKLSEEKFVYDETGRLTENSLSYNSGSASVKYNVSYVDSTGSDSDDSKISSFSYSVNNSVKSTVQNKYNDKFKRLNEKLITVGSCTYDRKFYYNKTRISKITDVKGSSALHNASYGYDAMGRIIGEVDNANTNINTTYIYDSFGQLIRENNKALDKTYVYSYNGIGNITSVKTYAYTPKGTEVSGSYTEIIYAYNVTSPDRLVRIGSTSVSYNTMGCPTTYDGYTASWTRGKLSKLTNGTKLSGTNTYNYSYNAYGQRTGKSYVYTPSTMAGSAVALGTLTRCNQVFHYDSSGRLVCETKSCEYHGELGTNERVIYLYDENGIIGMDYTAYGATNSYYFRRNLLGDVTDIYNAAGTRVAGYYYDAYGNCTVASDTTNYSVAHANSIRYRGYYYDEDMKLYYLNSRYYCPEWRRFISPDSIDYIDPESVNGLNLYAYCNNDPVNYVDPSGHFGFWAAALIGVAMLGVAGFAATMHADIADDGELFNGSVGADAYLWNTLVAGAMGGLAGGLIYTFLPAIVGFLGSSFTFGSYALASGEAVAITISGAQIAGGVIAASLGIMAITIGKSGGYTVKKYPNDHEPPHVHIYGDDINDKLHGIRIGLDGNPLPGQSSLPPGARKAIKKLLKLILDSFN